MTLSPSNGSSATQLPKDLGVRLVSGVLMAAASLGLTLWGGWAFAVLVLAVSVGVAWEWGRIVRGPKDDTTMVVHAAVTAVAVLLAAGQLPALALIVAIVGAIIVALLELGRVCVLSSLGVLYSALPGIALVWLRGSVPLGLESVLVLLLMVWGTDTGAYIAGRSIGGPKLMSAVSPNKTWSGLLGGMVASVLVACGAAIALPAFGAVPAKAAITGALVALISQAGDLIESALKRRHGVKDASQIIPGHGGLMDRVDGLIFAVVAAAIFGAIMNIHAPGAALLAWR